MPYSQSPSLADHPMIVPSIPGSILYSQSPTLEKHPGIVPSIPETPLPSLIPPVGCPRKGCACAGHAKVHYFKCHLMVVQLGVYVS